MIESGMIPREAGEYATADCQTCQLTHPRRRPVPGTAERSGQVTVQVDYMHMGFAEKGWKGEVAAYVYSSRYSKIVKAYPVNNASAENAVQTLKKYCANVIPFLGEKIDCVQTDAGTQFNSKEWGHACTENKLLHRTCPVDHQAMNGQVERVIGILLEKTRALLMDTGMHKKYWPLALVTAAYLLNRIPHESLGGLSPLQKSTGQKPDLSRARVFGCKAYVQVPKSLRKGKLDNTAWTGVMVGYSTQSPEWIILDTTSGRLRNAYSVTFDESKSGFLTTRKEEEKYIIEDNDWEQQAPLRIREDPLKSTESNNEKNMENIEKTDNRTNITLKNKSFQDWAEGKFTPKDNELLWYENDAEKLTDMSENVNEEDEHSEDESPGENQQDTGFAQIPSAEPDENNVNEEDEPNTTSLGTCMALTTNDINVPTSWRQARNIPEWENAMEREINELRKKNAWELVLRPKNAKVLPGVWNFRIKKDENGNVVKCKARWCVDGSRVGFVRPPENVFSPVAELPTVRTFMAIAAKEKQAIFQADFPNAYVNAEIEEDIYVCQPKGLKDKAVPSTAAEYDAEDCQVCQLTHPKRRPVPHTAERSGMTTVQVDYMQMGHTEKGWKGEVGAYIYSSRTSKVVKVYTVNDASTETATGTLKSYCKDVLPFLGENVDCIQTDAGTQFNTKQWKDACTENKMLHRTCPIDHQAMNGQVERVIGILATKTSALLADLSIEKKYWPLALEAASYVLNRIPHDSLKRNIPLPEGYRMQTRLHQV